MKLLSNAATNFKTRKKLAEFGYEGVIQHFTPDNLADGIHTVCPWSTPGCRELCLNTSGMSQIKGELTTENLLNYQNHRARMERTTLMIHHRNVYLKMLGKELDNLRRRADRKKLKAVARLNGTSDLLWENIIDMGQYPEIQFYDYTKSYNRMWKFITHKLPSNYHLTFSRSELTLNGDMNFVLAHGGNVAVVFKDKLPTEWFGTTVINGDEHDFRFRDPKGVIVGLTAKGRAKKDTSGFVVDNGPMV